MQMPELDADFIISNNNQLEAEYEFGEGQHFDCSFEIFAAGTTWGSITGNIEEQTDLIEKLSQKADTSTVEELSETVTNNYNTLDSKIDTHISDKTNPHEVTKAQVGLGNVDNTSDLNKPISTATQSALNGKQNTINDLSEIRSNASNGQSAYNTIQTFGDIVTYNASNFATYEQGQKADTALQPNDDISKLNNDVGYITSASLPTVNNSTITFQKNNITVGDVNLNQPNNETINFNIPTTASDVNALPDTTTIEDLTTTAQQNAINSGATTSNIGQISTNTSNINSLSNTVTSNYNTLDGRITSEVSTLNTTIGTETTNRQNADNNLQSQIDAIVSSSDVFDIVGTYAELQAYDISTVPVNDIIKVLVDSTHNNAATYYRCVETGSVKSWSYIGAEGAYYTKSESDSLFVDKSTTINGQDLSNNITLTASDVGALPSSTTIGDGTLTIQKNGVDVDTFDANATSNKSINIVTPTKTSDLTNDSGFIDSSSLSSYATQTDLTSGLATKQDTINDLSTIRSNAANGQSAYTTIGGYGDIVTYNASSFATSAQGDLADTALQQGDNISLLNNNAGFVTNADLTNNLFYKQDTLSAGTDLEIIPPIPQLPNGYTALEWIESDGACCIDLEIISNGSDYIEQKFQLMGNRTTGTISWFGSLQNTVTSVVPRLSFGTTNNDSTFFAGFNNTTTIGARNKNVHTIKMYAANNNYYINFDNTVSKYTPSHSTNPTINSYIFARNGATVLYDTVGIRIYYHKQNRNDGTPVLNLIPAKRNADDVLGFYDLVNNKFLTNSGTGTLTGGAEVYYNPTAIINFTNKSGYTSNIGTVTSVNNIQPDSSGNVTVSVTGGANTDLSNLTATGEAHFQAPLVSGTNIKTVNSNSLLGSGNITVANTSLGNVTPSSTFKANSVSWVMPNYSAGVTKSNDTVYTASNDCLVTARNYRSGTSGLNSCSLYVYDSNDTELAYVANISPATTGSASVVMFVPKGYKYKSVHNAGTMYLTEYPLKGV